MTSPLLALFIRSLREDTRSKLTYAGRAGLGTVLLLSMCAVMLSTGWRDAPGLTFFSAITWSQLWFLLLAGVAYFAAGITGEKEEGTLPLLRMTNLGPLSILLGKGASRLCAVVQMLAAQVPFTLLAATLGGVSLGQIASAYVALGAFAYFLCTLCLLSFVLASRTGSATGLVAFVVIVFEAAPNLLAIGGPHASQFLAGASTFSRLDEILRTGFSGTCFAAQSWSLLVAGTVCFLLAWFAFDRACDREVHPFFSHRWIRPGRPWEDAECWKDFNFLHGGLRVQILKFAAYGGAVAVWLLWSVGSNTGPTPGDISKALLDAGTVGVLAAVLEIAFAGSRLFHLEVREQTLSSLVLLPGTMDKLYSAKVHSCYHALVPVVSLTVGCFLASSGLAFLFAWHNSILAWIPNFSLILGCLAQVGVIFTLFGWLSLRVTRGALPLGITIVLLANALVVILIIATGGLAFLPILFAIPPVMGRFRRITVTYLEKFGEVA